MALSGDEPERLPGGFVNSVVRVGATVRRSASPSGGFVQNLVRYLEHCQWSGAPRHLGFDDRGRAILTFLGGHVAWEETQPAEVRSDESLAAVARLVRQFHRPGGERRGEGGAREGQEADGRRLEQAQGQGQEAWLVARGRPAACSWPEERRRPWLGLTS